MPPVDVLRYLPEGNKEKKIKIKDGKKQEFELGEDEHGETILVWFASDEKEKMSFGTTGDPMSLKNEQMISNPRNEGKNVGSYPIEVKNTVTKESIKAQWVKK